MSQPKRNCCPSLYLFACFESRFYKFNKLDIFNRDLPETTIELSLQGADAVMFGQGAFAGIVDIRRISIKGAKLVVFRQFAAVSLNLLNLYLDVEDCDILRFEKSAFMSLKGPLSVTIQNCGTVSVEGLAFSWLLSMDVANVRELSLGAGSFSLEPTAANVGEHGPGMSVVLLDIIEHVELKNTTISEFAKSTFGSSLAKLLMVGVDIHAIRTGAFSANTYNVLSSQFALFILPRKLNFDILRILYLNPGFAIFDNVQSGAINTTVASVVILDSEFHTFMEKGFELTSWNKLQMERNSFDELPPNAIAAPGASIHELVFNDNEIETMHPGSLAFIGKAAANRKIQYSNNYYGQLCYCNVSQWLAKALGEESGEPYEAESYCTVNEFFARCFNVPEQNMLFKKFIDQVCSESPEIKCEQFKAKTEAGTIEIKNPRFPHKNFTSNALSDRDKKVIGIVIVSCLACVIVALLISLIRWMRRRGYCVNIKNFLISSNSCGSLCGRLCGCGTNMGHDNARSISQMSVNEYSERHRLNESRPQDLIQESSFQQEQTTVPTTDKFTQTLPEELTKELLDNLKEKLDNPENYVEAREAIEHLYELTKMTEEAPQIVAVTPTDVENIYELPFQATTARVGRNNKKMVSVGTKTPSLEQLLPLSPYYRQTALAHEYFEPQDLAVHLYAEIANSYRENRTLLGAIPDVIAEQAVPRGPYLRAVLQNSVTPFNSPAKSIASVMSSPLSTSTLKSNSSNSSAKMMNRPLPEKPSLGPGEGTSYKHG
ncbi:Uncharacterized protein OBRU01_20628 [Operophtera brumata]|uniref:Uncharacterized protein n=1 Tax=Operophtera brumata TaxID=104452 RepID=A0A0L7KV29_OPEBR|nr:Uncharacterized protein OBRU01_20628 [Operophtera brumata]